MKQGGTDLPTPLQRRDGLVKRSYQQPMRASVHLLPLANCPFATRVLNSDKNGRWKDMSMALFRRTYPEVQRQKGTVVSVGSFPLQSSRQLRSRTALSEGSVSVSFGTSRASTSFKADMAFHPWVFRMLLLQYLCISTSHQRDILLLFPSAGNARERRGARSWLLLRSRRRPRRRRRRNRRTRRRCEKLWNRRRIAREMSACHYIDPASKPV